MRHLDLARHLGPLRRWGWGVLLACGLTGAWAQEEACRTAFDMGSSGIRVGSTASAATAQVHIDFFTPASQGRLAELAEPTAQALSTLPEQAQLPAHCRRMAGGFSVWRLALEQHPESLVDLLQQLQHRTGVAVLVLPPQAEGRYGFQGAQQRLGPALQTSHVLDVGGGSLQIAGADGVYGLPLGQKSWHQLLCQALRPGQPLPCPLAPLSLPELAQARALIAQQLSDLPQQLPGPVTLTAISKPVTRGIAPVLRALDPNTANSGDPTLTLTAVQAALQRLQHPPSAWAPVLSKRAPYLLSDLLLVEGLLQATHSTQLRLADLELNNIAGLLQDEQAFAWARHYGCYLQRLRQQGLSAYASSPQSCPPPTPMP